MAASPGVADAADPPHLPPDTGLAAAYALHQPERQTCPLVLASPHSGRFYPPEFLQASRLSPLALRASEDGYVDEIFLPAVRIGVPLLAACFPRAYVDPNREAFELDPEMFRDPLPAYVNTRSPRVAAGLGTLARLVASGAEIYRDKMPFSEALARIERYYTPYHAILKTLLDASTARFGLCLLLDCHSMPSCGGPGEADRGRRRVDFVLGDCHGQSCANGITTAAERILRGLGYSVTRNIPYAGGFTTRHYGRPGQKVHALQIEINRGLYLDEDTRTRKPYISTLSRHMVQLVEGLAALNLLQPSLRLSEQPAEPSDPAEPPATSPEAVLPAGHRDSVGTP